MGAVRSRMMNVAKGYNHENRRIKLLEKLSKPDAKPDAAPKHATTTDKFEKFRQENPEYLKAVQTKSEALHDNLKSVYVESEGSNPEIQPRQPIPLSSKAHDEGEMGVMDADYEIPEGRITLKKALEVISQHQVDPVKHSAAAIATEHKLDETELEHALKYFKVLELHIPKEMYAENKNLKKLVQKQVEHGGQSFVTQNLTIPTNKEIKEIKKQLKLKENT